MLATDTPLAPTEGAGLNRRTRFIAAASFALGIGVIIRPEWGAPGAV